MGAEVSRQDSVIKTPGQWESEAYQKYIKIPRDMLAALSVCLGRIPTPDSHTQDAIINPRRTCAYCMFNVLHQFIKSTGRVGHTYTKPNKTY